MDFGLSPDGGTFPPPLPSPPPLADDYDSGEPMELPPPPPIIASAPRKDSELGYASRFRRMPNGEIIDGETPPHSRNSSRDDTDREEPLNPEGGEHVLSPSIKRHTLSSTRPSSSTRPRNIDLLGGQRRTRDSRALTIDGFHTDVEGLARKPSSIPSVQASQIVGTELADHEFELGMRLLSRVVLGVTNRDYNPQDYLEKVLKRDGTQRGYRSISELQGLAHQGVDVRAIAEQNFSILQARREGLEALRVEFAGSLVGKVEQHLKAKGEELFDKIRKEMESQVFLDEACEIMAHSKRLSVSSSMSLSASRLSSRKDPQLPSGSYANKPGNRRSLPAASSSKVPTARRSTAREGSKKKPSHQELEKRAAQQVKVREALAGLEAALNKYVRSPESAETSTGQPLLLREVRPVSDSSSLSSGITARDPLIQRYLDQLRCQVGKTLKEQELCVRIDLMVEHFLPKLRNVPLELNSTESFKQRLKKIDSLGRESAKQNPLQFSDEQRLLLEIKIAMNEFLGDKRAKEFKGVWDKYLNEEIEANLKFVKATASSS